MGMCWVGMLGYRTLEAEPGKDFESRMAGHHKFGEAEPGRTHLVVLSYPP